MGLDIHREQFDDGDYDRFSSKLAACVRSLRAVVVRPGFGMQPTSVGAELELNLAGDDGRPMETLRLPRRPAAKPPPAGNRRTCQAQGAPQESSIPQKTEGEIHRFSSGEAPPCIDSACA